MPELTDAILGTPPTSKVAYAFHRMGSRLVGDRFLASYLADSLKIVDGLGPVHKLMLAAEGQKRGATTEQIQSIMVQQDDTLRWVAAAKDEGFHRTNVLAFLSLWAAHEAGHENVIAAIVETVRSAAQTAASKFKPGRFDMNDWPWSEETCLELAQLLDNKAKAATHDGGWDAARRLITIYAWLGATIQLSTSSIETFNEASMVRNVLLHRYGRLGSRDIQRAPHLAERTNGAIQLSGARLSDYSAAVTAMLIAVMNGVAAAGLE